MARKLKVLVTGGAGFIGSHLVDGLIANGYEVRALDALVPQVHGDAWQWPAYIHPEAQLYEGSVTDPHMLDDALDDVDFVFHEAAEVGVGQSAYQIGRYVYTNDFGTALLLEAIERRRGRIKKLIVASSMSVYGEGSYLCLNCGPVVAKLRAESQLIQRDWEPRCERCFYPLRWQPTSEDHPLRPTSIYAITKQTQEQTCLVFGRAYSIPTVALRYFNVYGSRQALSNPYTGVCAIFASRILNGKQPLIFEDGKQTRDFVHVSDIVQANLLCLETTRADYEAVNVGTGMVTSIESVARLIAEGLGRPDLTAECPAFQKYREGDIRHCIPNIAKARTLLGYSPKVSLEHGMPELIAWVRSQTATDNVDEAAAELASRNLIR